MKRIKATPSFFPTLYSGFNYIMGLLGHWQTLYLYLQRIWNASDESMPFKELLIDDSLRPCTYLPLDILGQNYISIWYAFTTVMQDDAWRPSHSIRRNHSEGRRPVVSQWYATATLYFSPSHSWFPIEEKMRWVLEILSHDATGQTDGNMQYTWICGGKARCLRDISDIPRGGVREILFTILYFLKSIISLHFLLLCSALFIHVQWSGKTFARTIAGTRSKINW